MDATAGMTIADARAACETGFAEIRAMLLASPFCGHSPIVREQAEYYVEQLRAVAFNLGIAPRAHYPQFLVGTMFGPNAYPIWGPNPDFKYAWTWLDGAKNYRIHGYVHDTAWASFQATSAFWGDPDELNLGDYPLDSLEIAPDGSYEIFLGSQSRPGNWIKLNPASPNNFIFLRRAIVDWERETVATAFVEMLDAPDQPYHLSENDLAGRIHRMGTMLRQSTIAYTLRTAPRAIAGAGWNQFLCISGSDNADDGYNPGAHYFQCAYDIAEEEVLLVEFDLTDGRYWGIHCTDIFLQSLDYIHHQSSLNASQAYRDHDGRYRFVLSLTDPGVMNWLDPVGSGVGMLQLRSYYSSTLPRVTATKLQLDQLMDHLPPLTAVIEPARRIEILRRRAQAILRHY